MTTEVGVLDAVLQSTDIFTGGEQLDLAYQTLLKFLEETQTAAGILDNQYVSQLALNEEIEGYNSALLELQRTAAKGINIDSEQLELDQELVASRKDLGVELDYLIAQNSIAIQQGEDQTVQGKENIAQRNEEIAVLRKRLALIDGLIDATRGVEADEEEAAKAAKKRRDKAAREERDRIRDEIKQLNQSAEDRINAINEQAAQETAAAENSFERAEIEAKRQQDVADVYSLKADEIGKLNVKYEENFDLVNDAKRAAEQFSEILGSEVINDLDAAFSDYTGEINQLKKDLEDGIITKDQYNAATDKLRDSLEANIESFKKQIELTPELEEFFQKLLNSYDKAADAEQQFADSIEDSDETYIKLGKNLRAIVDTNFAEVLGEGLDAAADAISNFNDTALENTEALIERELDVI